MGEEDLQSASLQLWSCEIRFSEHAHGLIRLCLSEGTKCETLPIHYSLQQFRSIPEKEVVEKSCESFSTLSSLK
jgi:hypothetical protein